MHNNLYKTRAEKASEWWRWLSSDPIYARYDLNNGEYLQNQMNAEFEKRNEQYNSLLARFSDKVSFSEVVKDNYLRFTALAFLDRLTVIRQTSLFNSFHSVIGRDSLSSTLNLAQSATIWKGMLRGNLLNFAQFSGVYFQALTLSGKSATGFIPLLFLLDTVLHPLDTIRTRWQADTRGAYKSLADCAAKTSPSQLFNGYAFKMVYTAILGAYFYTLSTSGVEPVSPISFGLLAAAYPFLTFKSIAQVSNQGSILSDFTAVFKGMEGGAGLMRTAYRGFLPFLALNMIAPYTFPHIWSKEKKSSQLEKASEKWNEAMEVNSGHY